MKITLGEERVIVRGIRPEEKLWGSYQFPLPYHLGDRIAVQVHVSDDNISSFGNPLRWFQSFDNGVSWEETDGSIAPRCGLRLPDGDRIFFPAENGTDLSDYTIPHVDYLTPGYDFTKKAEEGTLPMQDGMTFWHTGTLIRAYKAERLPDSLSAKTWRMLRIPAGKTEAVEETVPVDWPYLTRVVHTNGSRHILKPIFPRGVPKLGPDGAIWISAFSGEGHLNPENGQYSPYYSAELFRSEDNGKTFSRRGHMEYPADGGEYSYLSGGFSDSDFTFTDNGDILWFFRTAWFASTGYEWAPMYWARSSDGGFTWTKPEKFADTGILPRIVRLGNGAHLICYARPGIFLRAAADAACRNWSDEVIAMTPGDRSHLANTVKNPPTFHDWDGACNNPELLPISDDTALLFYSDFYYPDEDGTARKTILCREVRVEL